MRSRRRVNRGQLTPVRTTSGAVDILEICPLWPTVRDGFGGGATCPRRRRTWSSTARRPGPIPRSTRSSRSPWFGSTGTGRRRSGWTRLVRPSRPIPADATAVHGITDADVAGAPPFVELAGQLFCLLDDAVFVAHNAPFDLAMLRHGLARVDVLYRPAAVACTLDAFRLIEPLADTHRLDALCARHGIVLAEAHDALSDVLATAGLLRVLIARGSRPRRSSSTTPRSCGSARAATRGRPPSRRSAGCSGSRAPPGWCSRTGAPTATRSSRSSTGLQAPPTSTRSPARRCRTSTTSSTGSSPPRRAPPEPAQPGQLSAPTSSQASGRAGPGPT